MPINVRFALEKDLPEINRIRITVQRLHAEGKPDFFREECGDQLKLELYECFFDPDSDVIVALSDDTVCGFAMVRYMSRPRNPYMKERRYYLIEQFGVSEDYRRMGVATAMMEFIKKDAAQKGYPRVELDMWEFNQNALAFYETMGFKTYRRYMELETE